MSAFVTGKCRLKVKSAWGNLRIDGVFSEMRIEKKGDKFSRELDFWLISILCLNGILVSNI